MMKRFGIVLLMGAVGCMPFRNRGDEPEPGREPLQLCVRNATVSYGTIVAHAGQLRFDVLPGQQQCRPIIAAGAGVALTASTIGGGALGPLSYRNTLRPGASSCWLWTLTDTPSSGLDLEPCRGDERTGSASGVRQ